jgi:hypothetical protein
VFLERPRTVGRILFIIKTIFLAIKRRYPVNINILASKNWSPCDGPQKQNCEYNNSDPISAKKKKKTSRNETAQAVPSVNTNTHTWDTRVKRRNLYYRSRGFHCCLAFSN